MLESKWKKEQSSSSLTTYTNLKNKHCIDLINAKAMFTIAMFISMQHNSKLLFKLENSILGRRQKSPYPDFTDDELPHLFDSFFNDKINNIISSLPKPISIPHNIISNTAHIINESLTSGTVPLIFKYSIITPIIKKPSLDPSSFNNYRPISNLSIRSKTLERVVSKNSLLS